MLYEGYYVSVSARHALLVLAKSHSVMLLPGGGYLRDSTSRVTTILYQTTLFKHASNTLSSLYGLFSCHPAAWFDPVCLLFSS